MRREDQADVGCPPSLETGRIVGGRHESCSKNQHIFQLQTDTNEASGCKAFHSGEPVCTSLLQEQLPTHHMRWTSLGSVNWASQTMFPELS